MSTQRVPAWKRLGLKLKGAASDDSPTLPTNGTQNQTPRPNAANVNGSPAYGTSNKRNLTPSSYSNSNSNYTSPYQSANKRLRTDGQTFGSDRDTSSLRRQKSVSFASGTKDSVTQSQKTAKNKNKKKKKKPKAPAEPAPEFDLTSTVSYLQQWATARESWKFNKNHQTLLIKYVFDGTPRVPSANLGAFLDYIRDLKGGVRSRLRETATEIRKTDMEKGVAAFPADMVEREEKQRRYEAVIEEFLQQRKEVQQQRKEAKEIKAANGTASKSSNKRSFDEVEFVIRTAEPELQQRLIKRIRAELVLEELSDSDDSTSSADTTTTASSTQDGTAADDEMDVDGKPASGAQVKTKRRRIRNLRTAAAQPGESESESETESGEDTNSSSSSSSSDDESEDQEMEEANGAESSSSSSSSSEDEGASESGSDDDSDEEED